VRRRIISSVIVGSLVRVAGSATKTLPKTHDDHRCG
jgi:hypothetical protein